MDFNRDADGIDDGASERNGRREGMVLKLALRMFMRWERTAAMMGGGVGMDWFEVDDQNG